MIFAILVTLFSQMVWATPTICERLLGYHSEILSAGDFSSHTMAHPLLYAQKQLGEETIRHIKEGHAFTVVLGTVDEAETQMASHGLVPVRELKKTEGFHRIFEVRNSAGELGVVVIRVNTEDRLIHLHALAKIVGADNSQIVTIGKVRSWYPEWKELISQKVPDLVVYGMPNTALDTMLSSSPQLYEKISELYEKRRTPVELSDHELGNMHIAVLKTVDGKRLWFVPNLYGEMAKDFLQAVHEARATPTIFLGSCGAISNRLNVRDWIIPNDSQTSPELFPGLPKSRHGRVPTFLIETQNWLERTHPICDTIDVEYEYASQIYGTQDSFFPFLVVTDVLSGTHSRDISNWNYADQKSLSEPIGQFLRSVMSKVGIPAKFSDLETFSLAPGAAK